MTENFSKLKTDIEPQIKKLNKIQSKFFKKSLGHITYKLQKNKDKQKTLKDERYGGPYV